MRDRDVQEPPDATRERKDDALFSRGRDTAGVIVKHKAGGVPHTGRPLRAQSCAGWTGGWTCLSIASIALPPAPCR